MKIRKQIVSIVAACLMLTVAFILPGFESEAAGKTIRSITITNTATGYVLPVGKTRVLKVKTVPKVSKKRLKFISTNKAVATITKAGKIRAYQPGTTVIKVASRSKKKRQKSFRLYVGQRVTNLTFTGVPNGSSLYKGRTYRMRVEAAPTNAAYKGVTWSSSNKKVLKVNASGIVTAKALGSATITARAKDGSGKKVSKKITVRKKVTSVKITSSLKYPYMQVGGTATLKTTVAPSGAPNSMTWSSSNKGVATVSSSGKVTAKALGTATIKATSKDGSKKSGSYTVTVSSLASRTGESIAHRGYSGVAPENSRAAFALAAGQSFGAMECDVRITGDEDIEDRRFVLSHDDSLSRVFGSNRAVSSSDYDDIKDLVAVSGKGVASYPNERLLTLEDYMEIVKASGKRAVIEIKTIGTQEDAYRLYDMMSSYGINDRVEIISFYPGVLNKIAQAIDTYEERHTPKPPEDDPQGGDPSAGDPQTVQDNSGQGQNDQNDQSDQGSDQPVDPVVVPPVPAISFLATTPNNKVGDQTVVQWALERGYGLSLEWQSVTPAVVNQVHAAGQKMTAWVVNQFDVAYYLTSIGVDHITSDYNLFR